MDIAAFKQSLLQNNAPQGLSVYLQSLWYDGKGNWDKAHDLADSLQDKTAAWVHAYLHRKEGDVWNADYWYRRAGRTRPAVSLDEEWQDIVAELL